MTPLRILIVDDEPPIRRFLRTALTAQGYRIDEAADGEAALDFMAHNKVDLVVLDLGLPGIDGLEVVMICPLPSGPGTIILEPWKEIWNGTQASA